MIEINDFTRNNREKFNIAIAIFVYEQFDSINVN